MHFEAQRKSLCRCAYESIVRVSLCAYWIVWTIEPSVMLEGCRTRDLPMRLRLRGYSGALGLYVCWEDAQLRFFDPESAIPTRARRRLASAGERISRAVGSRSARRRSGEPRGAIGSRAPPTAQRIENIYPSVSGKLVALFAARALVRALYLRFSSLYPLSATSAQRVRKVCMVPVYWTTRRFSLPSRLRFTPVIHESIWRISRSLPCSTT